MPKLYKASHMITHLSESASTNKQLSEMDIASLPPYFTLMADYQSAGKGRGTHTWHSQNKMNILASTLVYSAIHPGRQFDISCAYSLAVCHVLQHYCHLANVSIKWPNDIYVNHKKIAGILIEHHLSATCIKYSIIGLGLNVNQVEFPADLPNPTSIALCTKLHYEPADIMNHILEQLPLYISMEHTRLRELYTNMLYLRNTWVNFTLCSTGENIQARIQGINEQGCLQILTHDNTTLSCELNQIKYNL